MQISDAELKKVVTARTLESIPLEDEPLTLSVKDYLLVEHVKRAVLAMPERADRVAELKERIEAGEYHVSGADIANAMIRRAVADRIR